jgi:hypothetical protein
VIRGKCDSGKCVFGEMSNRGNGLRGSIWSAGKCKPGKWSAGKLYTGKWSYGETYPIQKYIPGNHDYQKYQPTMLNSTRKTSVDTEIMMEF